MSGKYKIKFNCYFYVAKKHKLEHEVFKPCNYFFNKTVNNSFSAVLVLKIYRIITIKYSLLTDVFTALS